MRLELAPKWKRWVTALEPAADGKPNHYLAPDYDTLVDSPIVTGDPVVYEFEVDGSQHFLVDIGDVGSFDGQRQPVNCGRSRWRLVVSGAFCHSKSTIT